MGARPWQARGRGLVRMAQYRRPASQRRLRGEAAVGSNSSSVGRNTCCCFNYFCNILVWIFCVLWDRASFAFHDPRFTRQCRRISSHIGRALSLTESLRFCNWLGAQEEFSSDKAFSRAFYLDFLVSLSCEFGNCNVFLERICCNTVVFVIASSVIMITSFGADRDVITLEQYRYIFISTFALAGAWIIGFRAAQILNAQEPNYTINYTNEEPERIAIIASTSNGLIYVVEHSQLRFTTWNNIRSIQKTRSHSGGAAGDDTPDPSPPSE